MGGEFVGIGAALWVAHELGLGQTYVDLMQSLAHSGMIAESLNHLRETIQNPEMLKPAAMGVGFITGVVTDVIYSGETLSRLTGKINLQGTNSYTLIDGVRERDENCVDARIDRNEQDVVEPGAGQMGGAFIMNNALALALHNFAGDGLVQDFLTGYFVGRTLPTALITAGKTTYSALSTAVESHLLGLGPVRENKLPHDHACGWSGTENVLKHWLKFSKGLHEQKSAILDSWNRVDAFVNTIVWEPFLNTLMVPLSGFSYITNPNFGTTSIHESH